MDSLRFYPPSNGRPDDPGQLYRRPGHSSPHGLKATQTSYQNAAPVTTTSWSWSSTMTTPAAPPSMNALYSGVMCDFDIGTSTPDQRRRYHAPGGAAYMNERTASTTRQSGIQLLSPTTASNLSGHRPRHLRLSHRHRDERRTPRSGFMNGPFSQAQSDRTYDWSVITAAGPFDLPVGARQRVAYAVVGGATLTRSWSTATAPRAGMTVMSASSRRHLMPENWPPCSRSRPTRWPGLPASVTRCRLRAG